jgi:hypothetical protein
MHTVACLQLKWKGAKSAGHSATCNDFIVTACMHNMTCGDLACYNLDVGGEMATKGWVARIREENKSMLNSD